MANVPISKMQVPGSEDTLLLKDSTAANKVQSATNDNLAALDENGNLKDAGWSSLKTTTSASGNPISISGLKSNQLAKDPIITFEPIQAGSGDPSPSNIRAISGYDKIEVLSCGKNLIDKSKFRPDYDFPQIFSISSSHEDAVLLKPNTEYHVKIYNPWAYSLIWGFYYDNGVQEPVWGDGYDASNRATTEFVFTSSNYARHFIVVFGGYYGDWVPVDVSTAQSSNAILCENTQSITYEPYHKTTDLSLQIGQTIYGATLDLEKGVLTVDRKIDDLSNYTWNNQGGIKYRAATIPEDAYYAPYYDRGADIVAEQYKDGSWADIYNDGKDGIICMRHLGDNDNRFVLSNSTGTITGKFVYHLVTPFTIQLTPHEISLLSNYAYVSTNGTNMSFSYHNGEMASLADVAQVGQTVNELGDIKGDKIVGYNQKIDLTFIDDNIYFTASSDGILLISPSTSSVFTLWFEDYGHGFVVSGGATNANTCSIPLFKGMHIRVLGNGGTGNVVFIPYKYTT